MKIEELDEQYEAFKRDCGDKPFRIVISPKTSSELSQDLFESEGTTYTFLKPTSGKLAVGGRITRFRNSEVVVDNSSDFDGVIFQFVKP